MPDDVFIEGRYWSAQDKHVPSGREYTPHFRAADYMHPYMTPHDLRERIKLAKRALKYHTFDAIAFRGMSGAMIGPSVALELEKTFILVRKPNDNTHSEHLVEGDLGARRYVILDDFISSGRTQEAIVNAIYEVAPKAKCIGLLEVTHLNADRLRKWGKKYPLQQCNKPKRAPKVKDKLQAKTAVKPEFNSEGCNPICPPTSPLPTFAQLFGTEVRTAFWHGHKV